MDKQTLREIIFQSKQMNKQYRSANKKTELTYLKTADTSNKLGSICLLGSLQVHRRNLIPQVPIVKKFQIVQLKKNRSRTPRKQITKYDTALKTQMRNRQIRSHRQSFKVEKIENAQLGLFQKSLGMKFIEKPVYFVQGEIISIPKDQLKRSQVFSRVQQGKSSLNIESLPQKFIPSQILTSKQYKKIYDQERKKILDQKNQSIKKSLYLDFNSVKFNLSDIKDPQKVQNFRATEVNNQIFMNEGDNQRFSQINRATSMTGVPRKNYLKKIFQQQRQFQDKIQRQKKEALQIRKQVNKNYAKPFNPPQNISAQSYVVYEITKKQSRYRKAFQVYNQKRRFVNSHKILVQYNSRTPVEIASLTKIMTFLVSLQLCQKYQKDPSVQTIKIGMFEQNITGTTANLVKGQIYTLQNLFYGLMLPSGNDASLAIAVWGGKVLIEASNQNSSVQLESSLLKRKRNYYERFLQQMNKKAVQLGMEKTHYANSHGLMNFQNKSCASDLALLCEHSLKNKIFREVVQTKFYECLIKSEKEEASTIESPTLTNRSSSINISNEELYEMKDFYANQNEQTQSIYQKKIMDIETAQIEISSPTLKQKQSKLFSKKVCWQNTHILVQDKPNIYKGIKTGITNAAGPCLSSLIQFDNRQFLIIVINCRTMKQRFRDTQNLRKWTFQKEQINCPE